jgi:cytochrome c oxidase subunit II
MGLEERSLAQTGDRPERPHARADWKQMLGIGLVASVLGVAAGLLIDWFPVAASEEAKPIDTLWDVLIIASVPVFVGVTVVVLFSVVKFRMREGEENLDGPPIHGNTRLEVIWTAIPAILLVGLCTYAFIVLEDIEKAEANTLEVRVVGEQFAWTFFYPNPDGSDEDVGTTELYLPVNRPVKFVLQSKDVLHDFWIPAFRVKKDAVPGMDVTYRATPNRIGRYPIVCAELCGLGHATMRAKAVVVEPQAWTRWLQTAANPPAPEEEGPQDGKTLFTSNGCSGCHTLADAGSNAQVGPNLDEALAGRDEAFIKTSIEDPGAEITDGYSNSMPKDYGAKLGPEGLDTLTKYLSEVTKGG